ncbi:MAG: hypothetical protein ACYTGH_16735 [Planctomycetota bacterium]|jgi:hypothetical protein
MFQQTALFAQPQPNESLPSIVTNQCGEEVPPLSPAEEKALKQLESTVSKGIKSFIAVGTALMKIKGDPETPVDERLYRMISTNWGEYCKRMWGIRRSYADYTIEAVRVTNNLKRSREYRADPKQYLLPENEIQARPLAKLELWNAVVQVVREDEDQNLTGSLVKKLAAEMFADRFANVIEQQKKREDHEKRLKALRKKPGVLRSIDTFLEELSTECSVQELIALLQERSKAGAEG